MTDEKNPSSPDSSTPRQEPEDDNNPSVQLLKETAELSDITKRDVQAERNVTDSELKIELADPEKHGGNNSIETLYENAGIDKTISSVTPSKTGPVDQKPAEISNTQMSAQSGRMNKLRDQTSNIFPAGIMGCRDHDDTLPSPRRFLDAGQAQQDNIGHIDNMPRKMAIRNDHGRNPLLMTGMDEADKKKKGGDGVDVKVTGGSTTRIPPGGYSHGLW